MRMLLCFVAMVAFVDARAEQPPKSWKGERIFGKKPNSQIPFGDTVDGKPVSFPFQGMYPIAVREEKEGRLRIFDGHREGWANQADFVLAQDAPVYFRKCVQTDPKDLFAWYMKGRVDNERNQYDNAIKDFNECLRLDAKYIEAYNSRGTAWMHKKAFDQAIKDFDEAIRLDPQFAGAFNNRGNLWYAREGYEKAIKDFDEAIRLDPQFAFAFNNRGNAWLARNEYAKAVKDYDEVTRLDPKDCNAFYNKACCHALLGQSDQAIESLGKSLERGYSDIRHIVTDSDLISLRKDARFVELLKKYAK